MATPSEMLLNQQQLSGEGTSYHFGINVASVVAKLRSLADQIESGEILIQDAAARGSWSAKDFSLESFAVTVAGRRQGQRI